MKKLLSILLVVIIVATCSACSVSYSNSDDTTVEEKEEQPKIEYYPNTNVPTLDSLLDEPQLSGSDGRYLYGPYDTESEGIVVMESYVSTLVTAHGFIREDTSIGFELTDGTNTITIIGGNYSEKLAICVMID